jgi:predicted membrane protein
MNKSYEIGVLSELLLLNENREARIKLYKSGKITLKIASLVLCFLASLVVFAFDIHIVWLAAITLPSGIMIGVAIMLAKDQKKLIILEKYTSIDVLAVKKRIDELKQGDIA